MITRRLGNTDLDLTVIGLGAWAIGGGGWKFGWGQQDDTESVAAIVRALETGVNWIDTARIYGLGHSETVVRRALDETGATPTIVTKCSRVWDDEGNITGNLTRDSIRRELDASREALGGRAIDVYLIHQPYPDEDIETGWETLAELRAEGAVRYVGVSNFSVAQLERCRAIAPVDVLEPRYSLIARDLEKEHLDYTAEQGIGVISYSPMGSGLLTGAMTAERIQAFPSDDWRHSHPDFTEPLLSKNLRIAEVLGQIGARRGLSSGAVACAWALGDPRIAATIVGFRNPAQVTGILGEKGFNLTEEDIRAVRDEVDTELR